MASHARRTSPVIASHTSIKSPTFASHVGDLKPTSASHARINQPTTAIHVRGTTLVTASHTRQTSPTSASHVGDQLLAFASHVGRRSPATASHVGAIDMIEKPICIVSNPKFLCRLCKGDHLTCLCPAIAVVQEAGSLSGGPSSSGLSFVSQQSNPSLVDTTVMTMQYLADTTLVLGGYASLDYVVSHPVQLVSR
jgi:hypothetical protein